MLVASKSRIQIQQLKETLNREFDMKDLSQVKKILGIEVSRDIKAGILHLCQKNYLHKVLETFHMTDAKSVQTPLGSHVRLKAATELQATQEEYQMKSVPYHNAVGSLMYAMIGSRPDIAHSTGLVSRFMRNLLKEHWTAVKGILRYIEGTQEMGLQYKKEQEFKILGYCDADFASDLVKRRSTSDIVFFAGGNLISWKSGLQRVVALSTTESEYMALTEAVKEAIWLRGLCSEFGFNQEQVEILCDSQVLWLWGRIMCTMRGPNI